MMRLPEMPGARLIDDMDEVGISTYVFDTNCRELEALLLRVEEPEAFWAFTDARKRRAFFQEVTRLLHNAVASARSLRERTHILTNRWYADVPEAAAEVKRRQTATFDVPEAQFVQQLRNVMLKARLPPQLIHIAGGRDQETHQRYILSREGLLSTARRRWPSSARSFLENSPEEIHVLPIVQSYRERVQSYYFWLEDHLRQTHARIIGEFESAEREYFILELEDRLGGFPKTSRDYPGRKNPEADVFHGILDESEQDSVRSVPIERRATLAIRILERKECMSEAIRDGVRRLYEVVAADARSAPSGEGAEGAPDSWYE
ncbi:MAG: hypothetical protein ACRDKA_02095 [Actinomycetota bacterium]